jgi:ammonia channel protein AmtB
MKRRRKLPWMIALAASVWLMNAPAYAELAGAQVRSQINGADTGWVLVSSLLVLMMTIPGLALF